MTPDHKDQHCFTDAGGEFEKEKGSSRTAEFLADDLAAAGDMTGSQRGGGVQQCFRVLCATQKQRTGEKIPQP